MKYLEQFSDKSEFYYFVANRIKMLRESLNFTQDYVSEKIDMSICNYSKIERNLSKCPLYSLVSICDLFDITLDEFFYNNDSVCKNKLLSSISKMSTEELNTAIKTLENILEYYKINKK